MSVREVKEVDLSSLASLFDAYRVFYRKQSDLEGAKAFLSERLNNQDSKIFVCENEQQELLGFVQLYPLFSSTRMKKAWLLNDLFVNPNSRGRGISIQLIERAKELVRDTDACGMFLETEKSNKIGNKLYPKAGMQLNSASNYYEWQLD